MAKDLLTPWEPAILALADGSVFHGSSVGVSGETQGEVVFNTAITGYQEILTDPSYAEQIITLTYPHIGNVGVNPNDNESNRVWAAGLIIRECSITPSNWRATQSLPHFLQQHNIVAIAHIDTRRLTRLLREKGAQSGCIMTGKIDASTAVEKARAFSGLNGKDLTNFVSTKKSFQYNGIKITAKKYHVVVLDMGVKRNILSLLAHRDCAVTVLPAQSHWEDIIACKPDGILLSNGPGDPAACHRIIAMVRALLMQRIPMLGICLGFQLIALACGAKTVKMKLGHHGTNHPVQALISKQVFITSQNHGFTVDRNTLPNELVVTHISLFDGSLQGFQHKTLPVLAFQGHPEASPGPQEMMTLFDDFIRLIAER